MASQPPQVTQADIDAYIANYQAQLAKINAANQAALSAAQQTGASNIDYYVNPIGAGEIIPGMNAGILSNLGMYSPEYQAVMRTYGSRNDQGNVNDVTERSTFAVNPSAQYRLVDASGNVIGSAASPTEVRSLVDTANALSQDQGKKAEWKLQQTGATGGWNTVAQDDPNTIPASIKMIAAAMAAATAAGALQPGGFAGTGAGASNAAISSNVANAINTAYTGAQAGAASALAPIYGAGAAGTAIGAGTAGGLLSEGASLAPGALSSLPNNLAAIEAAAKASLAGSGLTGTTTGLVADAFGNLIDETGAIVASGGSTASVLPEVAALTAAGTTAAATSGATGATPAGASDAAISQNVENAVDTAYKGAQTGAASDIAAAGYSGMGAGPFVAPGAGATVSGGVLGTGLNLAQLAAVTGIGVDLLSSLIGGGGGAGTTTGGTYVSPFGATGGTMAGDFRASPAIANYEQYGFGPEASFFRPEYYGLVSGGASKGYTPLAGTATPTYTPLIGGATTGGTPSGGGGGGGAGGGGGGTVITKQERPAGFTGVVSGQQVGDTQVVDGNTWVWGGDDLGWQRRFDNGLLSTGNGATNVSSFANNPTVAVNQPAFAQNTAIPGWATTYHGFQQSLMNAGITGDAKAAAERELFTAIETQPFASATDLVDYAKGLYTKYTANPLMTTAQAQAAQRAENLASQPMTADSANQRLANDLLTQAQNLNAPNGFVPQVGTVLQTPEWDKLWLDYVTGKSTVAPPRLVGYTPEEFQRKLEYASSQGPQVAQQTADYWAAVRGDPRYSAAAQYEMTTGESAGLGPYIPSGYASVGNSVMKIGTPEYEQAIRGLI